MTIHHEARADGQFCWMDVKSHFPAHVAYYLATDNIDDVVSDAEAAGAEVVLAPFDAGDEGSVATLIDLFGGPVSLVQRTGGRTWSHPTGS